MRKPGIFCWILLLLAVGFETSGMSQPQSRSVPPPLRVFIPFTSVWKTTLDVLEQESWKSAIAERGKGIIQTAYREFSSGPLTQSAIRKIGEEPKLTDGQWMKVESRYVIQIDLIGARETVLTVNTDIRARERTFLGEESWVEIPTNGHLEEDLLTVIGRRLFGQTFSLDTSRKGFWKRDPVYVPNPEQKIPKVASPERPPL